MCSRSISALAINSLRGATSLPINSSNIASDAAASETVIRRKVRASGSIVVSAANVLLLDEPTNNLDPASRAEILGALAEYQGSVIMVSHDEGAVQALKPERVILLPDGDEDLWKEEYFDLVSID